MYATLSMSSVTRGAIDPFVVNSVGHCRIGKRPEQIRSSTPLFLTRVEQHSGAKAQTDSTFPVLSHQSSLLSVFTKPAAVVDLLREHSLNHLQEP